MINASDEVPRNTNEIRSVVLLSIGFGLVGLDRFMIIPMFPALMTDLGLSYRDLGHVTGVLAITWGISSVLMGRLSDVIGARRVAIGALVVFSLLAGCHGLAAGIGSLLLIRALMGLFEGAYTPAAIVATLTASAPSRHGLNLGIQQAAMPLFGLALAPILITQMLQVVEWRTIFVLLAGPGLIVAALMVWVLRDPPRSGRDLVAAERVDLYSWQAVFAYRNVVLAIGGMFCWLTSLIVTSAMFPSYLMDYLKLNLQQMGFVTSAVGFGAALGTLVMPTVSDRVGRKPVMVAAVSGAFLSLLGLTLVGANPPLLFALLFSTCFFNFSLICLTVGPVSAESVPASLMATATGMVVGLGEIFGGGVAPIVSGHVAERFGIQTTLYLGLAALAVGFVIVLGLRETAPTHAGLGVDETVNPAAAG